MDNYRALATAIASQACEDYVFYTRKLRETKNKEKRKEYKEIIDDSIEFITSDRFVLYTNYRGDIDKLIDRLDYLVDNYEGTIIKFFNLDTDCGSEV